jgi:hypothetical protein
VIARRLAALALALAGAACAPRVAVTDAISGAAVDAQVRAMPDGSLLIQASGYESWAGAPAARVALHPLWMARFAGEAVRPPPHPPRAAGRCAGCPAAR